MSRRTDHTDTTSLENFLRPIVEQFGCDLEAADIAPAGRRRLLRVLVDRDGGISLDDVAEVTRAISKALDADDFMGEGAYTLEVSSPGVDRPLTRLADFETYKGYDARIELDRLVENRKRFKGVLAGVEDQSVAIDLENEDETALVPFAWISEAKLVITDNLMKRGAEARAARLADEERMRN